MENTVNDLLRKAAKDLRARKTKSPVDQNVGWLEAEVLLASVVNKTKAWVIAHGEEYLGPTLRNRFLKLVKRRKNHEPVAHILGHKEFYGRSFKVNRHTLIPRPETELFIDVLKLRQKETDRFLLLDAGTGCGEIAVTSALEFPKAKVIASDISKSALKIAEANIKAYKVTKRVTVIQDNLLGPNVIKKLKKSTLPLIIAMNLPYLPERYKEKLEDDVVKREPHIALFGGEDGLYFIKKLLDQINDDLNTLPKTILIEFDPSQSRKLQIFASKLFPTATISAHNDLAQKQRLLEIRFE
jgi:release factor glutamine methyltransferase